MPTRPLPLADAIETAACGGKAANLARLIRSGVPVPAGFVLPDSALQCETPDVDRILSLLPGPLIVRSSAIGEDSAEASFAGMLESIGDVTTANELRGAIEQVRASRRAERVVAYEIHRGKALAGVGVIVQRQVEAALSGVLFTVAPDDPRLMLLEYCGGMGEALVSGAVNPGRVTISRTDSQWRKVAAPDEPAPAESLLLNDARLGRLARLALDIEGIFGAPQDIEWALDAGGRLWIVQARPITGSRGSRGSRGSMGSMGSMGSENLSDLSNLSNLPRVVWSNANVNENFPQPISPLLYSIARLGYYHYFRNLGRAFGISARRLETMEPALRQIIGVHGARMYYNLTSIHSVLRSAPFGELLAGSFNQFVGAEETAARPAGAVYRLRQVSELAVIAAKTTWQYLFLTRRVEAFERTVDSYAAATRPDRLESRSLTDLLSDFRGFIDIRCNRWKNASLADAGSMVCYGLLQRLLARALPQRDQQALHNTLLKALPDLVSGVPPLRLWELSRIIQADRDLHALFRNGSAVEVLAAISADSRFSRFNTALQDFLENWGFRCSAELMLTVPSFQEDPAPVIALLKAYATVDRDSPADLLERQAADRVRETAAVMKTLGWPRALVVRTVLQWTQRSIRLRERARLKQALLYSRLRRISLAIGERLAASGLIERSDDVFFLSAEELELLAAGGEMFPYHVKPLIALRRGVHAAVSATTPPDSVELAVGEYLRVEDAPPAAHDETGRMALLTGVGACGGSTTAAAAILLDVTESHKLRSGDVLVTRQTDPGWGPIFPLISGLVIERGGMLSHGAIIAREFGIPSVVGVKDATRLIPHGGRVTVDGSRGLVHVALGGA